MDDFETLELLIKKYGSITSPQPKHIRFPLQRGGYSATKKPKRIPLKSKICVFCGKEFVGIPRRKYCSSNCQQRRISSHADIKKPIIRHYLKPWKDPESLFCSPNLKEIIRKEPLQGTECKD